MRFDRDRFNQYLWFVAERHRVWQKRQQGRPGPWTEDPILASRKFTNVFRVLDPGSQFIFNLDHGRQEDVLLRLFLYRHTGRVEAWRFLREELGEYPTTDNLEAVYEVWRGYRDGGRAVFTGAYLVYPQSSTPGTDKLYSILGLTDHLFNMTFLSEDFLKAATQQERFKVLRRNKGVADFMSMQILTDWGYTDFGGNHENEYVVPGPGCRKGVATITDARDVAGFLAWVREEVLSESDCPVLDFGGHRRYPSLMDIQNTMCEFSKYVRYLNSGATSKPYSPAHPGAQPTPILPAHWA